MFRIRGDGAGGGGGRRGAGWHGPARTFADGHGLSRTFTDGHGRARLCPVVRGQARADVGGRWGFVFCGRRGMSLVEVMISMALLSLLSLITVSGMIYHSRVAKSNLSQQRMAEGARRFVQAAQIAAIDSTLMRVDDGPAGDGTVLTIGWPDPADSSSVVYKQYAFLDGDGNPATLRDNVLVERDEDSPLATTGKVLLEFVSPVTGQDVFSRVTAAGYPLFGVNLHVGDRTFPANAADNAFTGPGYQGFRIQAFVGRGS